MLKPVIVFLCMIGLVWCSTPLKYDTIFDQRGSLYNLAMNQSPNGRKEEALPMILELEIEENDIILDAPAGGGFVGWSIHSYVPTCSESITIIEVEPSAVFATGGHGKVGKTGQVQAQLYDLPNEDESVNKVSSLAGLHHLTIEEKKGFFSESFRVLKSGGRLVVSDVGTFTPQQDFLNVFVDKYTHTGHAGVFFAEGEFVSLLQEAGFTEVKENLIPYKWRFSTFLDMLRFTKNLFGLEKIESLQLVHEGLREFNLFPQVKLIGAEYDWSLRFAVGFKNEKNSVNQMPGCSSAEIKETHDEFNLISTSPAASFNRLRNLLTDRVGWILSPSGNQGYYNPAHSETACGSTACENIINKLSGVHFPLQDSSLGTHTDAKRRNIVNLPVITFFVNQPFIYARYENEEGLRDVIAALPSIQHNFGLESREVESACYSVQLWTINYNLEENFFSVSISVLNDPEILSSLGNELVQLFTTDLNCSFRDNEFDRCDPPSSISNWRLLFTRN